MHTNQSAIDSGLTLAPQCTVCGTALSGPLSYIFRLAGISRSTRNPNICNRCNTHIEEGRIVELSVLFADLSKFTELTHDLGPEQTHEVVNAFLDQATNALVKHGAFIDKYIGDAVMAFFNVPIQQEDHTAQAVAAAVEIQAGLEELRGRFNLDLNSAIGIAAGWARVGSLGSAIRKDYTAIGDVVNLAARLEGQAQPGEILVQDNVYEKVATDFPNACPETLTLKGFHEPVVGYRLGESACVSQQARAEKYRVPIPSMSLSAVIFALLGAPCAAGILIGPLAAGLGIGTMFGALATYWAIFDKPLLQYPLFALATVGSLANLYTVWHAHNLRKQGEEGMIAMTRLERYRTILVAGSSMVTLLAVANELYLHATKHPM
jgi:adenylate cyclase